MRGRIKAHLDLCKIRISLFSTLAAATGFILVSAGIKPQLLVLMLGVFLLACGSSALNQYQEKDIDALMPRTKGRPLPSGRIDPRRVVPFSSVLIFLGSSALLMAGGAASLLPGLFAVLWYNGVYTPLKRITAFAVVPGALVGAIPPAVGWAAGGGSLSDPKLSVLCFFFFMWQIPHFWLLVLNHGDEYRKAGLPSLTALFSRSQLSRLVFIWIAAAAVSTLFLFACCAARTPAAPLLLFAAYSWLLWNGIMLLMKHRSESAGALAFRRINLFMFLVMVFLSVDKLLV